MSLDSSVRLTFLYVQDRQRERQERADDEEIDYAFKLAALYITLAFALQPKRDVYKRSLKVSRLPHPSMSACCTAGQHMGSTCPLPRRARHREGVRHRGQ